MKMPLFGKSRVCTHFPNRWVQSIYGWLKARVAPVSWARSTLSLAWFVLWGDTSQEQAEKSSALGPAPRTRCGAKCRQVGGLDSPSQTCAVLHEHPPGETCWLPRLRVQRPAQHKETEQRQDICFNRKNRNYCCVSISAVCVCNSALFTVYDIHMGFSIQITQTTKT